MKTIKKALSIITAAGIMLLSCGCSVFGKITGGETLRILSGSENAELSAILDECEKQTGVKVEMTYKGSVDIMQELKNGAPDYDAVWTASSLWISLGDEKHIVKHGIISKKHRHYTCMAEYWNVSHSPASPRKAHSRLPPRPVQ